MERKVAQLLAEGATAVLHKPIDVPTLLTTLRQLATEQPTTGPVQ
jgi:CheY-like chemotaxis protein